jgi:hypothetical protein
VCRQQTANAFPPKPFSKFREVALKQTALSLRLLPRGGFQMLALKFVALALAAVTLISMFSPDFSSDLVLAIVSCLT